MGDVIVLTGFMGAGKTTVGRLLADALGLPFLDADAVIEERTGMAVREIFARDGEPGFRSREHETIVAALDGADAVLAVGGGAVEHPETRRALEEATVVHLDVGFEEAMARVGADTERPMLHGGDVRALYDRRQPVYTATADVIVPTDGRSVDEVVADVIATVRVRRRP